MGYNKKAAVAVVLLGLVLACNRAGRDDLADQRHFDSLVARRDTIIARYQAQQDSVAKVLFGASGLTSVQAAPTPIRSDSDLEERPPVVPQPPPPSDRIPTPASALPQRPVSSSEAEINAITQRGLARGDSLARADAGRLLGNGSQAGGTDSVRGVVQAERPRSIIKTSDRTLVSLSGMATDGIPELPGAEIVVHGLKVSSRDMVVKSYVVVTMKGVRALDGRLDPMGKGWMLTLSDGSGVQRLSGVPALLQAEAGSRVWVTLVPGTSTPQAFGTIGRR